MNPFVSTIDGRPHEEEIMIQGFGDGEDILGIFSVMLTDKGKRMLDDWSKVDESLTHDRL